MLPPSTVVLGLAPRPDGTGPAPNPAPTVVQHVWRGVSRGLCPVELGGGNKCQAAFRQFFSRPVEGLMFVKVVLE